MNKTQLDILIEGNEVKFYKSTPQMDYYVSKSGNVYSVRRKTNEVNQLTKHTNSNGYHRIVISKTHLLLHRIVATVFIKEIDSGLVVNHKNGIKTDNRVENLEVTTQSENLKHAYKNRLNYVSEITKNNLIKTCHERRKFTPNEIREIRNKRENGKSFISLGKEYNVSESNIRSIFYRRTYKDII